MLDIKDDYNFEEDSYIGFENDENEDNSITYRGYTISYNYDTTYYEILKYSTKYNGYNIIGEYLSEEECKSVIDNLLDRDRKLSKSDEIKRFKKETGLKLIASGENNGSYIVINGSIKGSINKINKYNKDHNTNISYTYNDSKGIIYVIF